MFAFSVTLNSYLAALCAFFHGCLMRPHLKILVIDEAWFALSTGYSAYRARSESGAKTPRLFACARTSEVNDTGHLR